MTTKTSTNPKSDALDRIAEALERMSPAPLSTPAFESADAFVWQVAPDALLPVSNVSRVEMGFSLALIALGHTLSKYASISQGSSANAVGARGMGKSSLNSGGPWRFGGRDILSKSWNCSEDPLCRGSFRICVLASLYSVLR